MQNLTQLLANPMFNHLIAKAQYINTLNQSLTRMLPADLKQQCSIVDIKLNCLILQASNSAWATRLRYETPDIIRILKTHKDFINIESIRWQVQPQTNLPETIKPSKPKQAEIISNLLKTTSEHIKNQKLHLSLKKLAESASPSE